MHFTNPPVAEQL